MAPRVSAPQFMLLCLFFAGSVVGSGCGCIERVDPADVAAGVARLQIRSTGYFTKLILNDKSCGFASPRVQQAALVQGQPGQPGAVTYTVKDCVIELPPRTNLSGDCVGDIPIVDGKLTMSGTQRIVGTVTGDPATPIIPSGAEAVRIELDVTPDNFTVRKSHSKNWINNVSGPIHYVIEPRIALSKSLGVCAVQTLDFSFSGITMTDAKVIVGQGDHVFPVDVPSASLTAQSGKWGGHENDFSGVLNVWGTAITLPLSGDTDGLDPDYTPQAYLDSISCNPDLVVPVSYACPSLKEQLVHGVSRLSVKELGAMASLLEGDTRCGLSSPAVLAAAKLAGSTGAMGSATMTVSAPCTFTFASKTVISTDCLGVKTYAQGTVSLSGTEVLSGVLTGDVTQPVAPNTMEPAQLTVKATFTDFTLSDSVGGQAVTTKKGTLTGTVRPRLAVDTRSDICSNTTSIATLSDIGWQDATLAVNVSGFDFDVDVSQANLNAQSGPAGDRTNTLSGTVVSDGVPVTVPPLGVPPVLDPSYDAGVFLAGFSCAPGFQLAQSDADCSIDKAMATNAARLTVQAAGTLAGMIQNDTSCGFSALGVKTSPSNVVGSNGQMGLIEWDVTGCQLGSAGTLNRGPDCLGATSYVSGSARVSAHRTVTGERNSAYVIFDSIIPRSSDAMTIALRDVSLSDFAPFTVLAGEAAPYAKLVLHGGTLTGTVKPALGERASTPGIYDVGTPVATFTNVTLSNATGSLFVGGKRFELTLPAVQVSAQNGTLKGVSNTLSGTVELRPGTVITIPPGTPLDPSFTQASFDQAYACTADLKAVLPSH